MKLYKIIVGLILVCLNIAIIPFYMSVHNLDNELDNFASSLPANTAYLYSFNTTFYEGQEQPILYLDNVIASLEKQTNIASIETYDMLGLPVAYYYNDATIIDHQFVGNIQIPVLILSSPQDQKLDIKYGRNLEADNEVVISSSIANKVTDEPQSLIGQTLNDSNNGDLEIVGIYSDSKPYTTRTYNSLFYPFTDDGDEMTTNLAYTSDSTYKQNNKVNWYVSENGFETEVKQQVLKITFADDNIEQNINSVSDYINPEGAIISNLGIIDNLQSLGAYSYLHKYSKLITRSLVIVDLTIVGLIITTRRKGQHD